jgi:hypothetical protein
MVIDVDYMRLIAELEELHKKIISITESYDELETQNVHLQELYEEYETKYNNLQVEYKILFDKYQQLMYTAHSSVSLNIVVPGVQYKPEIAEYIRLYGIPDNYEYDESKLEEIRLQLTGELM